MDDKLLQILQTPIKKADGVFIADTARCFGKVTLENNVSVWFGAVIRGDSDEIKIGENTNIQDNAVIHADPDSPCIIGKNCVIGHSAIVHGAIVADCVLIGMHATILNNATIGKGSVIGANALVPQNMKIPPYSLVMGVPAKVVKTLDTSIEEKIMANVAEYVKKGKTYKSILENK